MSGNLREILEVEQAKHLKWIEAWAKEFPRFNEVYIVPALTYELIQTWNNLFLNELLSSLGSEDMSL